MKRYLTLGYLCMSLGLFAQENKTLIQDFMNKELTSTGFTKDDLRNWEITDQHLNKKNSVEHIYLRQRYENIPLANATASIAIKDGKVVYMANHLLSNLKSKVNATMPGISAMEAINSAVQHLGLTNTPIELLETVNPQHYLFAGGTLSREKIPVELVYHVDAEENIRLAWELSIYTFDKENWYSVRIDAITGELLFKNDWVSHCQFDGMHPFGKCNHTNLQKQHQNFNSPNPVTVDPRTYAYNVFPIPVESPNHGNRQLLINPADRNASPFGWHDDNGAVGAEYTYTRGNNVYAYDDVADQNSPGSTATATTQSTDSLSFDYVYDRTQQPSTYQNASLTNLFYMNNIMHDVWYQYGFDEGSGNFQQNNYQKGGTGNDVVYAECQDGGGSNNANFATPPEGNNPTMQMYLWNTGTATTPQNLVRVTSPFNILGGYGALEAGFGPGLSTTITADFVLIEDAVAPTNDGCDAIVNAAALSGKIVLIDRGACSFVDKVTAAQNAGALGVIVMNNAAGNPIVMGGTPTGPITIPSVMVSQADGNTFKNATTTINGQLIPPAGGGSNIYDGSLDNGIMAHEYGHGISTRLTGGASNSNCLSGDEQMGEGWSDWFALMLTIESSDQGSDSRGMGTYANGEPVTGVGIRPAPYSTDFAINNYTYGDIANTNITVPHGVGFVWATILWDLNWKLIDFYGGVADPNVYTGTGGNNIAMQLVMDGIKLQACDPGFVDGRDAILQADINNYGGAHQCLIWEVFAKRGVGYNAIQGSANSRSDQTEAFDLPPSCMAPTTPPSANFNLVQGSSCQPTVAFQDSSSNIPQQWFWDFGDGDSSTMPNPSHTYPGTGTYTVTLIVTNNMGADTISQTVTVALPANPTTSDQNICAGDSTTLTAIATNNIEWYDNSNTLLQSGSNLNTGVLNTTTVYQAQQVIRSASQYAGPSNNTFGGGGYHGTTFTGTVNFNAVQGLEIVSAWVDAQYAGPRTFYLWDAADAAGNVIDQVTVDIPFTGSGRINLGFVVPTSGTYSIGGAGVDLYRNNAGASYPYTVNGLIEITGSSAGTDFYYYLYDLEVQELPCRSGLKDATVFVADAQFTSTVNNSTVNFTNSSAGATSWFWDFGDGNTSTAQNPTHTYGATGTYTVTLSVNNGQCTYTEDVQIVVTGVSTLNNAKAIVMRPNPASDYTVLSIGTALDKDAIINIIDISGKVLRTVELPKGNTEARLDLNTLSPAVYMVEISTASEQVTKKLIVTKS